MTKFKRVSLMTSCAALMAVSPSAMAQNPAPESASSSAAEASNGGEIEEIIVTAQLRSENLQKVPLSISVVTGETLAQAGIVRFQDLGTSIPNFTISANPISDTIAMRGISSASQPGGEQKVGIYVDGIYRGRGIQSRFAFLDIDRLEVLRGPQGTLFGRNTIAGAVNITTGRPTEKASMGFQGLYEFNNHEIDVRGHVSGPLTDRLRVRLAGTYNYMDKGWTYNAATGRDMPKNRNWALRGSMDWDPTDTLNITGRYEHGSLHNEGTTYEFKRIGPSLRAAANAFGANIESNIDGITSINNASTPIPGLARPPQLLDPVYLLKGSIDEAMLRGDLTVGTSTISAIGGYSHYKTNRTLDGDFGPLPVAQNIDAERFNQYSGELRLTSDNSRPFYYLVGAFYQRERLNAANTSIINYAFLDAFQCLSRALAPGCTPLAAFSPGLMARLSIEPQTSKTWALFGQGTYRVTDSVELTVGLRYGENHKNAVQSSQVLSSVTGLPVAEPAPGLFLALPTETVPHRIAVKTSNKRLLPQASLRWELAPTFSLYARYAKGTQDGGVNLFYSQSNPALATFKPESSDDYELGFKAQTADRRVTFNLNLYNVEYKNLQTTQFTGSSSFIVGNAASARARGVEVDARVRPFDGLVLVGSGAYNDFKFKNFVNAGCTAAQIATGNGGAAFANAAACANAGVNNLSGRTNQIAPKLTFNLRADYTFPLGDTLELTIGGGANHSSGYYSAGDLDPNLRQPAFTKYDASIALATTDGGLEVALVGRNLTNERTFFNGNDTPLFSGSFQVAIERTRTIALRTSFKY